MRLRTLFIVYGVSTVAAIATPFVLQGVKALALRAMPVNTEAPLQWAPGFSGFATHDPSTTIPACVAPNGTEYFGVRGIFYANAWNRQNVYDDGLTSYFASCAIRRDGTVYVEAMNDHAGWLRSYDPSHHLNWEATLPRVFSRIALSKTGTIYFETRPQDVTVLVALNPDGSERWEIPAGRSGQPQWELLGPAIGPDGTVYAMSGDASTPDLMAITPDGQTLWTTSLPGRATNIMVGNGGTPIVYLPSGNVIAYGQNGQLLWRFTSDNRNLGGGIAVAPDGTVYFASNFVYALDGTGHTKWTFKSELTYTKRDYFDKQPLIAEDGTIYALSCYQQLYAITPGGRKKWHLDGKPTVIRQSFGHLALTGGGKLITMSGSADLSSGLANSGWPSENRDSGNTRSTETW